MPSPRALSLRDASKDDAKKVNDASQHILDLLDDPYYFEAYQNLRRDKHPRLNQLVGRKRKKVGDLAAQYQSKSASINAVRTKMPKRGRPKTIESGNYDYLIAQCIFKEISLKEGCRRIIKGVFGTKTSEDLVLKFYTKVYGYKRRKIAKLKN